MRTERVKWISVLTHTESLLITTVSVLTHTVGTVTAHCYWKVTDDSVSMHMYACEVSVENDVSYMNARV